MLKTNRTAVRHFYVAAFLIIITIWLATCSKTSYGATGKYYGVDTTAPVQRQYVFPPIPERRLSSILDSLSMVVGQLGASMTVDNSNQLKQFYYKQISALLAGVRLDTIPKPKK